MKHPLLCALILGFVSVALQTGPGGSAALAVEVRFTARLDRIFTTPDASARPVGRLGVAVRLEILERKDNWLRVKAAGWHQQDAARVLYALPGKRILVAILKKSATHLLKQNSEVTDPETDIVWKGVTLEGWVKDKNLSARLDDLWTPAWELFSTRCTVCHQRRIPEKYTANQWRSLLKVMGPRTGLPKPKQQLILTFLQYHAKDTAGKAAP